MTALAQGATGIALALGLLMLGVRQTRLARLTAGGQSVAVAIAAGAAGHPVLAVPACASAIVLGLLGTARGTLPGGTLTGGARTGGTRTGGARTGGSGGPPGGDELEAPTKPWMLLVGAALTMLCQFQTALAEPLSLLLLGLLLAADRRALALIVLQNGLILAGAATARPLLDEVLYAACALAVPLPVLPHLSPIPRAGRLPGWAGWVDVAVAFAVLAATLTAPLGALATVFAPLLALDGLLRAWLRRRSAGLPAGVRVLAAGRDSLLVLAAALPNPLAMWLALIGAMVMALLPGLPRHPARLAAGFAGAGIALAGLTPDPSVTGAFGLFAGGAVMAAAVPDVAAVLVILLLRQPPWPAEIATAGLVLSLGGAWVAVFARKRPHLLLVAIAAAGVCAGPDGRFAAAVLLLLIILTRSAARFAEPGVSSWARLGLGGVSPIGVFPGVALTVLATAAWSPLAAIPLAAAIVPAAVSSLPKRPAELSRWVPSPGWLPLGLAVLAGYLLPEGLTQWLHTITSGHP